MLAFLHQSDSLAQIVPIIGLAPDPGFPIWLTPDPDNYMPLKADQTSGLDWVMSDVDPDGNLRSWFMACDDSSSGSIHLISIADTDSGPSLLFRSTSLTLPPPSISGIPVSNTNGYDWEGLSLHPWSNSIFLSQEGRAGEIAIYLGKLTPSNIYLSDSAVNRAGVVDSVPGYIVDLKKLNLPGWNETFGSYISDNMGIEGIACSEDRLFLGLESPYSFTDRLLREKSTILAVWKIDPDDPSNLDECELLSVNDTADWADKLQCVIETICGLDAIDSTRLLGIDRDNQRIFTLVLDESGKFSNGRVFYIDCPGPAPLPSDDCPSLDHQPRLLKPSLESIAAVPGTNIDADGILSLTYYIYLAVDPWIPGWALAEQDWSCPAYERRLSGLLPAVYRYSVESSVMFP